MTTRAFLSAVVACCLVPAVLQAQPVLKVVEGTSLDFGTIYRGEQFERKLTLTNAGTDTLVLGNVEASCGCTGTVLSNTRLAPDQKGSLLIKFNSRNFSGPVHKTVTVHSNSSEAERTMIEFTATVYDEIVLTPPQFWFKDAPLGKPSSLTLTLKNAGKDTLRVSGYRTLLKELKLDIPKGPINPGSAVEISATITPAQPTTIIADRVFLETNNPRQPDVAVPVYGNVKP